jgi:hypothetical protein
LELKRRGALLLLERGGFDGMAMEAGRGSFIYGEQLVIGVKIYPKGVS